MRRQQLVLVPPHRRGVERGVLAEDRCMQPLQVRSRLDADLFHEQLTRTAIGLQGLGLPA